MSVCVCVCVCVSVCVCVCVYVSVCLMTFDYQDAVCNSIFCYALVYEIERQLEFPTGMDKVLCDVMLGYGRSRDKSSRHRYAGSVRTKARGVFA